MVCGLFFRRRESTDVEDLFIAHIAGMDTLARGLRNAVKLIEDGSLDELVRKRYSSFDTELGAQIEVIYSLLSNHIPLICNVFLPFFISCFAMKTKTGWEGWFWNAGKESQGMGRTQSSFSQTGKADHKLYFSPLLETIFICFFFICVIGCCRNLLRWFSRLHYKEAVFSPTTLTSISIYI